MTTFNEICSVLFNGSDFQTIQALLNREEVDLNQIFEKDGDTPLQLAISGNGEFLDIMELLLQHGADPDFPNRSGWLPLESSIEAAVEGDDHYDIPINTTELELLLKYRADINKTGGSGKTVREFAKGYNWPAHALFEKIAEQDQTKTRYYPGLPFTEQSVMHEIPAKPAYFRSREVDTPFTKTLFERIVDNKIDTVVYQEVNSDNADLAAFHDEHYPEAYCFTENKIGDRVYKLTVMKEGTLWRYEITQYDHLWRTVTEQFFDANHLLVEYRRWFYENDEARTPSHEKIFSSWRISEEKYR